RVVDISVEVGALGQGVGQTNDAQVTLAFGTVGVVVVGAIVGSGQGQSRAQVVATADPGVFSTDVAGSGILLAVSITQGYAERAGLVGTTNGPVVVVTEVTGDERFAGGVSTADGQAASLVDHASAEAGTVAQAADLFAQGVVDAC